MTFRRTAAMAGIGFVVLATTNAILVGDAPAPGDELQVVREYVERDQLLHKLGLLALVVALAFAVVFFAGVVDHLRASDSAYDESWAVAVLGGAILMGAAATVGVTLYALLVYRGGTGLDDATLRLLKDGELIAFSAMGISIASVTGSAAVPTLLHHTLPRWHGLLSVVVAASGLLGVIGMVSATNAGTLFHLISVAGLAVWVLATSVVFLRAADSG
jgi:hypothetical protein